MSATITQPGGLQAKRPFRTTVAIVVGGLLIAGGATVFMQVRQPAASQVVTAEPAHPFSPGRKSAGHPNPGQGGDALNIEIMKAGPELVAATALPEALSVEVIKAGPQLVPSSAQIHRYSDALNVEVMKAGPQLVTTRSPKEEYTRFQLEGNEAEQSAAGASDTNGSDAYDSFLKQKLQEAQPSQ